MSKHDSGSHGHHYHAHHHHHHETSGHHHHDRLHHNEQHEGMPPLLSRKERLVKRLEIYIHHSNDHAGNHENLVNEAVELGGEQTAQLIRAAAEFTARQTVLETDYALLAGAAFRF